MLTRDNCGDHLGNSDPAATGAFAEAIIQGRYRNLHARDVPRQGLCYHVSGDCLARLVHAFTGACARAMNMYWFSIWAVNGNDSDFSEGRC